LNDQGVPQGSVLATILFIIYVNDLKRLCRKVKINFFADETLLHVATRHVKKESIYSNGYARRN
jgi:hypothetical protein